MFYGNTNEYSSEELPTTQIADWRENYNIRSVNILYVRTSLFYDNIKFLKAPC